MNALCTKDWVEAHTRKGNRARIVGWYFRNGEGHLKLEQGGKVFESPDVFWDFDEDEAERRFCR